MKRQITIVLAGCVGIVLAGTIGVAVWVERPYLSYVGIVWLVAVGVLPVIGVTFLVIALLKYLFKSEIFHIGVNGTGSTLLGKTTVYAPLRARSVPNTSIVEEEEPLGIEAGSVAPIAFSSMLGNEIQAGGAKFLQGFDGQGSPVWCSWEQIASVVVAGLPGSGKTVTMLFIALQLMLSKAAKLIVIDPHFTNEQGLTKRLKNLAQYGTFIHTESDILREVRGVQKELQRRVEGGTFDYALLLMIDEFNRYASRSKELFSTIKWIIEEVAQEGRKYDVFVILAGQIWQPSQAGGSSLINSIPSVILHRLKRTQSKFLGVDTTTQKQAETLPPGNMFFLDLYGNNTPLSVPLITQADTRLVHDYLEETRVDFPLLPAPLQRLPRTPHPLDLYTQPTSRLSSTLGSREGREAEGSRGEAYGEAEGSLEKHQEAPPENARLRVLREVGKRVREVGKEAVKKEYGITGGRALQELNAAISLIEEEKL